VNIPAAWSPPVATGKGTLGRSWSAASRLGRAGPEPWENSSDQGGHIGRLEQARTQSLGLSDLSATSIGSVVASSAAAAARTAAPILLRVSSNILDLGIMPAVASVPRPVPEGTHDPPMAIGRA
jgi:hypothetical protein